MALRDNFLKIVQTLIYLIPVSLVAGSLIVNINLFLSILIGYIYFFFKNIPIRFDLKNKILIFFFFVIILSSFINIDTIGIKNFFKSLFLLKFFLIYLLIDSLIYHNKFNLRKFFNLCLVIVVLVSLDLILQFFIGKNILGIVPHEGRIAGIFGAEAIAGGYLQKFFLFSLISIFTIKKIKFKNQTILEVLLISIIFFASFIASNRMSFVIVLSTILFMTIFYNIFRKKLFFTILILLPVFFLFIEKNNEMNIKFKDFSLKTNQLARDTKNFIAQEPKKEIKLNDHGKIYYTTFKSFEESIYIGNGLKSFRYKCSKFNEKNTKCSTHSHNYHLEILHDSGIIGFILLTIFVIIMAYEKYKNLVKDKFKSLDKIIISLIFLNFLIEIFPIKSTGSLFSTWTGTIFWISLAVVNFGNNKKNEY